MARHPPPVPPDQRTRAVEGASSPPSKHAEVKVDPAGGDIDVNLNEQGSTANIIQNTTHQGHQQDR